MRQSALALLAAHLSVGWGSAAAFVQPITPSSSSSSATTECYRSHGQILRLQPSSSPRYVAVDRQFSHDIEDKHASNSASNGSNGHVQSLWVFVHSLQRERRDKSLLLQKQKQQRKPPVNKSASSETARTTPSVDRRKHHPAKSLVSFLGNNRFQPPSDNHLLPPEESDGLSQTSATNNVEPFSRAVVQAIRLASELGDYKLILHLVQASIHYANEYPIIMPRVFGEAIDGLAKTSANSAKIKQLWNLGASQQAQAVLTEPLGTFELNIMIKAMASRGKIRAALDLYQECTNNHQDDDSSRISPDPFTLSAIFTALQDSIVDDQANTATPTSTPQQQATKRDSPPSRAVWSQCWQWNEATQLLESYLAQGTFPPLNNHVFSSLLKLNDRASQVYSPAGHNGPKVALSLLHTMHELNISPDVVTCTLIISNLGFQWKTAVNMLYAMKTTSLDDADRNSKTVDSLSWQLPRPNVYTYSAAITNCAHCHQYQAAMELLQEMKNDDSIDSPNTWVYNAALLATTRSDSVNFLLPAVATEPTQQTQKSPKQKRSRERLLMAMKLLREMQQEEKNDNCRPDTVTYNTVLATLDGIASPMIEPQSVNGELENQFASFFDGDPTVSQQYEGDYFEEMALNRLLDEMQSSDIKRDSITYRNALLAVRFSNDIGASVNRVLDRALLDTKALSALPRNNFDVEHDSQSSKSTLTTATRARQLDGKAADGTTFVLDTAMAVLSSRGEVEAVLEVFNQLMKRTGTVQQRPKPKVLMEKISSAQIHLVHALGRARGCAPIIPLFLNATQGDPVARLAVLKEYPTMDEKLLRYTPDSEALCSSAISSCLVANDIENARAVLALIREKGLKPSQLSLQEIARTYARLAVNTASDEARKDEETDKQHRTDEEVSNDGGSLALIRAKNAYNIAVKTLSDPPASLLSTIARTCATLGLWTEASTVVKLLHNRIKETAQENMGSADAARAVLPALHRALLRASSIQGNVTAALSFVDSIQRLSKHMASSVESENDKEELFLYQASGSNDDNKSELRQGLTSTLARDNAMETVGMSAEDWKLLLIAASKSGHWRVCLSTLQFLRPFLEETHPSSLGSTVEERSRRYGHLAPALTVALKCLEKRSQYAWAVRAIDDWIEWCGRRPPKEAVLAAIRILSKRSRGSEVSSLLARCTVGDGAGLLSYSNDDSSYGLALHVGAITALYKEGLYDDADDVFIAAVRGNFLPFDLYSEDLDDGRSRMMLDLHGMNVPVAHSAVRVALQQEVEVASWTDQMNATGNVGTVWDDDMIIVTGRGRNSALRMRPVLRPEVQRMLVEEFYPPLSTASIPGNMGALRVPAVDIKNWLFHQRQQKGSRMLAVASVLRNVSSIDRLRQSIARKIQVEQEENAKLNNDDSEE